MEQKNKGRSGQELNTGGRTTENTGRQGNQREQDLTVKGDKGHQQQGNNSSRQGDGGNRGKRGNTGLG
jgi:hypothetical protein